MRRSEEGFIRRYYVSQVYVRVVHRWLRSRGKEVFIAHQELAPSYEVRWDYVDEGDLLILLKGILRKMEVKHRENMKFTDPYMFPFSTVIVNEVYKWDKVPDDDKPVGHFILNDQGSHCFYVHTATTVHEWTIEKKKDDRYGRLCDFYMCPRDSCWFFTIPEEFRATEAELEEAERLAREEIQRRRMLEKVG